MGSPDVKMAKGILFIDTVAFLRAKKGEAAVAGLEKKTGPLIFDQYRMYPLDDLIALQRSVVELLYGKGMEQGYRELGADAFKSFTSGVVGATLTNVANSPKELLEKIQELWATVLNFGARKLVSIDESKRHALIEIRDDPRDPAYLEGVIEAGLKSIGVEAKTEVHSEHKGSYSISVTW